METFKIIWYGLVTLAGLFLLLGLCKGKIKIDTEKDKSDKFFIGLMVTGVTLSAFSDLLLMF